MSPTPNQVTKLDKLRLKLRSDPACEAEFCPNIRMRMKKKLMLPIVRKKLQKFVDAIKSQPGNADALPKITFEKVPVFNRKSWKNVTFDPKSGVHIRPVGDGPYIMRWVKTATKERLAAVASQILKTLDKEDSRTVRHIYYVVHTRNLIHDMAATMRVPRFFLNVYGSCWGSICGDFMYRTTDYAQCGNASALQTIPKADTILSITSEAKFVLIVETDATAQHLVQHGLQKAQNCIIIASRGFPDGNTRQIVKLLWDYLQVPIFALTDCDPSGMEIMATYRFGSLSMAYDSAVMVVPAVRWLGILPHQVQHSDLSQLCRHKLAKTDHKKIRDLRSRPYIQNNPMLMAVIDKMVERDENVELEAFTDGDIRFLADKLIPDAIAKGHWI